MRAVGNKVGEEGAHGPRQIMLVLGVHYNDFGFCEQATGDSKQRRVGIHHVFLEHHLGCLVDNRV